jgi:uncharacterized protein
MVTTAYPGIYVEEIPSGVHPITGVSTSDTAFIDWFAQGPVGVATRVTGFDQFLSRFGPLLDSGSPAGYGIMQFFINGGQVAWIVRVAPTSAQTSSCTLTGGSAPSDTLVVSAISPGKWGDSLEVGVDWNTDQPDKQFNLAVRRLGQVGGRTKVVASEVFRNVTMSINDPQNVVDVVTASSVLISVTEAAGGLGQLPTSTADDVTSPTVIGDVSQSSRFKQLTGGSDPNGLTADDLTAGLDALEHIEPAVVNLLCIPHAAELDTITNPTQPKTNQLVTVAGEVAAFCETYRCFYLLDIPRALDTTEKMVNWLSVNDIRDPNRSVHFPRLQIVDPNPLNNGRLLDIASSGTLAGIYSRVDSERGIWKAPAGTATQLRSIASPSGTKLNDQDSAQLNPLGVNVIRNLPVYGTVSWGARTLFGADVQASEWKYVPVRRTAMYIEESLAQGLRWVCFESNDEPLWAQIRLNVGAFMQTMFRRSAFQGRTPREAYLVKCDSDTTTQADIDTGVVNILIGFAPLKPAEFVVIQLQQLTQPPNQ